MYSTERDSLILKFKPTVVRKVLFCSHNNINLMKAHTIPLKAKEETIYAVSIHTAYKVRP